MEHSLFSERWVLWQEVWPKSGMTVGGLLYELPMPAHHTAENESSFSQLPTVRAAQGDNRNSNIWERDASKPQNLENALWHILPTIKARDANAEGYEAGLRRSQPQIGTLVKAIVDGDDRLLPTPSTQDNSGKCRDHGGDLLHEFICGCERSERKDLADEDKLLRTPRASDGVGGALGEKVALERGNSVGIRDQVMDLVAGQGLQVSRAEVNVLPTPKALDGVKGNLKTSQERLDSGRQVDLPNVAIDLIGTPRATASESSASQVAAGATKGRIEDQVLTTNWGKFEPAIRRWEAVTRPAPAPTKPDGKDGNHRLSSLFTEWMMGLPAGWVTGHGLKRNDELKMCGNGVVPQQAILALRLLLGETTDIPKA
jgi:DNA (cytosine-5)-methyltransferase 1